MTQTPPSGGNDPAGSASPRQFDGVELSRTVPVTPANTPPDQVLSHTTPPTNTASNTFATGTTGSGTFASGGQQSSGQTQDKAAQVVDQVQDKAGQAADQAQQKAGEVVDQAKQTVTTQASSRKDQAAQSLMTVADALRQTGQNLRGQEQGAVAGYADTVAERVENFSHYLQERDLNQLVGDVERYARQNPALFLGGAFALGLAAARFLKSSSQPSEAATGGRYGQYRPAGSQSTYRYQPSPYRSGVESGSGTYVGSYRTPVVTSTPTSTEQFSARTEER